MEPLSLAENIFNMSSPGGPSGKNDDVEKLFAGKSYLFFKIPVAAAVSAIAVNGIRRIDRPGVKYSIGAPFGEGAMILISVEMFVSSGERCVKLYEQVRQRLSIDTAVSSAMAVMVTMTPEQVGRSVADSLRYKMMRGFDKCLTAYDSPKGFVISGIYPKE